ncbi:50S ribosomal protein L27 [Candidatus Gracilibacteria bacterium]|nr:50S ribosomal protein L27 [Candidatus Gracilibacteria bacterium]
MAHKKAAGSTKNLKDSKPKYRGVKIFGGQTAVAGNIIIRQKGNKFECGKNVYMGRDFTILAKIDGIVSFKKKKFKRFDGRIYLKTVVEVFPSTATVETVKKAPAKKAVEKKETVKKAPAKKAVEKKETVKKTPAKKAVEKKETVKKAPAKKAVEKKAPAKKA